MSFGHIQYIYFCQDKKGAEIPRIVFSLVLKMHLSIVEIQGGGGYMTEAM